MKYHALFLSTIGLGSSLVVVAPACSHDWDAYTPAPQGTTEGTNNASSSASASSGAGGATGATSSSGAGGATGATSSSGSGGQNPTCPAGLVGPKTPCGGIASTFDNQAGLDADWTDKSGADDAAVIGGEVVLHMTSNASSEFVETNSPLTFDNCSIWIKLVDASDDPKLTSRIGLSVDGANTYYSIGLHGTDIEARAKSVVASTVKYDAQTMRYLRLRQEGGAAHFDTSTDGVCWTEFFVYADGILGPANIRLGIARTSGATGADVTATFDDFNITP